MATDTNTMVKATVPDVEYLGRSGVEQLVANVKNLVNSSDFVTWTDLDRAQMISDVISALPVYNGEIDGDTGELNDGDVEYGTTNGWTWKKWKNGEAECYGKFPITIPGGMGSDYIYNLQPPFNFLNESGDSFAYVGNVFTSLSKSVDTTAHLHVNINASLWEDKSIADEQYLEVVLSGQPNEHITETDVTIQVSLLIKGRWK